MKKDFKISFYLSEKRWKLFSIFEFFNRIIKQIFHKLRSIIIGKIRFSYLFRMNLQKLMERRLKKEKRWIARGIERWISSFGSKNEEQEKEERSGHRSTSFDPIEKDSVRFLRLLSKLGQIYREFVRTNRRGRDNASKNTFLHDESYFLIPIRIYLKILTYHIFLSFLDPIKLRSIILKFGANKSISMLRNIAFESKKRRNVIDEEEDVR